MTDTAQDLPHAVPLEGASNLRDLGGWPVADGRRVRRGLLYRSATLANLTESDQARVAALNIRTVCDLRGVNEAALRPSRLPRSAEGGRREGRSAASFTPRRSQTVRMLSPATLAWSVSVRLASVADR